MDFVKSIETARKVPEGSDAPFDPFAPATPKGPPLVDTTPNPERIAGVPAYPELVYHCQRFFIGRELKEILEGGAKLFDDRDESDQLRAVMDKQLQGKAVIWQRQQTILGDGSVVVWLEWSEKSDAAKAPSGPQLSLSTLMSPERVTPRSAVADKAQDALDAPPRLSDDIEEDEGDALNFNEEDDW